MLKQLSRHRDKDRQANSWTDNNLDRDRQRREGSDLDKSNTWAAKHRQARRQAVTQAYTNKQGTTNDNNDYNGHFQTPVLKSFERFTRS